MTTGLPSPEDAWEYWSTQLDKLTLSSQQQCYIRGKIDSHAGEDSGALFLVCLRKECELGGGKYAMPFQQQLPMNCLPETAVIMRAKHLATHGAEL